MCGRTCQSVRPGRRECTDSRADGSSTHCARAQAEPRRDLNQNRRGVQQKAKGSTERRRARPPVEPGRASTFDTLGRAILGAAAAITLCGAAGLVTTLQYNLVLGRSGDFDSESLVTYLLLGARALIAPVVHLAMAFVLAQLLWFVWRLLRGVSPGLHVRLAAVGLRLQDRLRHAGLFDPTAAAQATLVLGLVAFVAALVTFQQLLATYTTRADIAPSAALAVFAPGSSGLHTPFRVALSGVLIVLAGGLLWVAHLRSRLGRHRTDADSRDISAIGGIVVLAVLTLLLQSAIWRVVWGSTVREVTFAGQPGFVIGETADYLLLHLTGRAHATQSRRAPGRSSTGAGRSVHAAVYTLRPEPTSGRERLAVNRGGLELHDRGTSMLPRLAVTGTLLIVVGLSSTPPADASAWKFFGWLDELSGPGPFKGPDVQSRALHRQNGPTRCHCVQRQSHIVSRGQGGP
jgi:hypothetical protein